MTTTERREAYIDRGCENRRAYLAMLAEDYDIDLESVYLLARILGPDEDFDMLIVALEDAAVEDPTNLRRSNAS